jgi:hypothetical protein
MVAVGALLAAGDVGRNLFHVKHRRCWHLAVDLQLDAPLVTVGNRYVLVSCAPAVPRNEITTLIGPLLEWQGYGTTWYVNR